MTTPLSEIVAEALRRAEEWVNVPMQASDAAGLREELREAADRLQSLALSGAGEVAYSARFSARRGWEAYPMGTRAYALEGGYWERVPNGWKWCSGSTFPTPGADAFEVAVPATHPVAPGAGDAFRTWVALAVGADECDEADIKSHVLAHVAAARAADRSAQPAAPAGGVDKAVVDAAEAVYYSMIGNSAQPKVVRQEAMRRALAAARLPGGGEANLRCAKCRVGSEPGTAAYAKLYREAGTDLARCIHCGCSYGVWDEVKHDPRINAAPPPPRPHRPR